MTLVFHAVAQKQGRGESPENFVIPCIIPSSRENLPETGFPKTASTAKQSVSDLESERGKPGNQADASYRPCFLQRWHLQHMSG